MPVSVVAASFVGVSGVPDITIGVAPSVGQTLVVWEMPRSIGTVIGWPGFTEVAGGYIDAANPEIHGAMHARMLYRVIESGDDATFALTVTGSDPGIGVHYALYDAVLTPTGNYARTQLSDDGCTPPAIQSLGTVTPSADGILHAAEVVRTDVTDTFSITYDNPDFTELTDPGTYGSPFLNGSSGYAEVEDGDGPISCDVTWSYIGCHHGGCAAVVEFAVAGAVAPSEPFVCALDDADLSELVCIDSDDLVDWMIRKELQDTGSGFIVIHRSHLAAAEDVIKKGNWLAVTIPQIDTDVLFVFQMEQIESDLVSADEGGGELIKIAGRGELSYMERYREHPRTYVIPDFDVDGVKHGPAGTGNKVGQLLNRLLAEGQHVDRGVTDFGLRLEPLQHLTHDFDYDDDSAGDPWNATDMTDELSQGYVGDSGLHAVYEYIGTGEIDIVMWPTFLLQAFNSYGRDLSGASFAADVVRFVKGVNIAERLARSEGLTVDPTHTIVQGQGVYGFAETPSVQTEPHVEGHISTFGTDAAALEAIGVADMARRLRQGESVQFRVKTPRVGQDPDPENGLYLPGPEGSNGNYWIGDTVTIHTGDGFRDYDDVAARVVAVIIKTDEAGDLEVTVELKATTFRGRMVPQSRGITGGSSTGGASAPGGTTPAPPPSNAAINAHVLDPTDAHDASAISIADAGGNYAATNVETALAEVMDAEQAHEADTVDAHDASAISIVDTGGFYTGTTVEAALQEAATLGGGSIDALTDVTITSVAAEDTLQYIGGVWVNSGLRWEPVTDGEDVFVWESDDLVMEWKEY